MAKFRVVKPVVVESDAGSVHCRWGVVELPADVAGPLVEAGRLELVDEPKVKRPKPVDEAPPAP